MRGAVVAALTLGSFNNRCDFVDMANVARLFNNLHSMYIASRESFVELLNCNVFDMFKERQGGVQRDVIANAGTLEREGFAPIDAVSASVSVNGDALTLIMTDFGLTCSNVIALDVTGGR